MGEHEDYINAVERLKTTQKVIPNATLVDYGVKVEHNESRCEGVKETYCKYTTIKIGKDSEIKCLETCWLRKKE